MKNYEQLIEANRKYLQQNGQQKRYSFNAEYYNDFLSGMCSDEVTQTMIDLFNYGYVCGHKQATAESKKADQHKLDLSKEVCADKERLLRLVYDMPFWADTTYQYLYAFIVFGMSKDTMKFPEAIGHEQEIADFLQYHEEEQRKKLAEEEANKPQLTEEEKARKKALSNEYSRLLKYSLQIESPEIMNFLSKIAMNCVIDSGKEIDSEEYLSLNANMKRILDIVSWLYKMKDWKSVEILHTTTNIFYNDELKQRKEV